MYFRDNTVSFTIRNARELLPGAQFRKEHEEVAGE